MSEEFRFSRAFQALREKAEQILVEKGSQRPDIGQEDLVHLIHELEVHHVELELQNEELRRVKGELEKSQSEFVDLYESAPVAYLTLNEEGVMERANRAANRMLQFQESGAILGQPFLLWVHSGDTRIFSSFMERLATDREAGPVELRLRMQKGPVPVQLEGMLSVSDDDGRRQFRLALVDISERKRMEEELRRAHDELEKRVRERTAELDRANKDLQEEMGRRGRAEEQLRQSQKMEAVGTLAGGIAHDFNNILSTIVINSEMGLLDALDGSSIHKNLDLIYKAGIRGRDLVRQMLLFSRKSQRKQETLSLTPFIEEIFKLLRSSLPTTIQMELHLEAGSDAVNADPSQIQQVVMNLCTNAAYALRGTKGVIDISLRAVTFGATDLPEADMKPGDYLVLSVRDTGPGMDEAVKRRIFEPFFTTKPVGEGTGLGLSVVYGIVKAHRGRITVYSEPGKGSIFRVYLPKVDAGLAVEPEVLKPVPGGKERVLYVDDEEIMVRSVQSMLEHLGYKVTALSDSEEALRLFSEEASQFDLVMTDQTMPSMTGEELGREMMRIRPDIPVILCTGFSDLISAEKITAMGFRALVMKPFTVREGAELVRRVLDQKRPK